MKRISIGLVLLLLLSACGVTEVEPEAVRAGSNEIYAHRGDLEARPDGWIKTEWDNSVQAISSARDKNVSRIEIDLQLNRSSSALAQNSDGILYVHHEAECDVINENGEATGTKYNIATAPLSDVDKCAERLSNILNTFSGSNFVLEMKFNAEYASKIPQALYNLLKARGERTVHVVSSLEPKRLADLKKLADADGVNMSLLRVFGWRPGERKWVSQQNIKDAYDAGYASLAFHYENITQENIDYAKNLGATVGGWHWDKTPAGGSVTCDDAVPWAVDSDFDFMMIDCISDLQAEGWN